MTESREDTPRSGIDAEDLDQVEALPPETETVSDRDTDGAHEPFRLGYRPELDGIRAVAVGIILFAHLFWFFPWIARNGQGLFLGVDIFFALSGFLLTSLLIEERSRNGRFSFRGFYERRILRLLPSLYTLLVALVVYIVLTHGDLGRILWSSFFVVFYIANFAWIYDRSGFSLLLEPTWSLSVEEQYYLLFFPALILLLTFVRSTRVVLAAFGTLIAAVALWRMWLSFAPDVNPMLLYARTDTRIDALLVGPFAAFVVYRGFRPGRRFKVLVVVAAVFAVSMAVFSSIHDVWLYRWALTPLDISLMILILAVTLTHNAVRALLARRPVVWMGRISYELYIWHYPVFLIVANRLGTSPWCAVLSLGITFAVSAACYHLIAQRFLDIKRRRAVKLRGTPGAI